MEFKAVNYQTIQLYPSSLCPQQIYAQKDGSSVFLRYKHALAVINLDGDHVQRITQLAWPKPNFPKECGSPSIYFAQYSQSGTLNVAMYCSSPSDDTEHYLYARTANKWVLQRTKHCGTYDVDCDVVGNLSDGRATRFITNLEKSNNPNVVSLQQEMDPHASWEGPIHAVAQLKFGDLKTVLRYNMGIGPDTGVLSLQQLIIYPANGKQVKVCCTARLLQHYLLAVQYTDSNSEVVDLRTGDVLIRDLKMAMWRY
jgi:hypothetical protein